MEVKMSQEVQIICRPTHPSRDAYRVLLFPCLEVKNQYYKASQSWRIKYDVAVKQVATESPNMVKCCLPIICKVLRFVQLKTELQTYITGQRPDLQKNLRKIPRFSL